MNQNVNNASFKILSYEHIKGKMQIELIRMKKTEDEKYKKNLFLVQPIQNFGIKSKTISFIIFYYFSLNLWFNALSQFLL